MQFIKIAQSAALSAACLVTLTLDPPNAAAEHRVNARGYCGTSGESRLTRDTDRQSRACSRASDRMERQDQRMLRDATRDSERLSTMEERYSHRVVDCANAYVGNGNWQATCFRLGERELGETERLIRAKLDVQNRAEARQSRVLADRQYFENECGEIQQLQQLANWRNAVCADFY